MTRILEFTPETAELIRSEIRRARGNEVCFVASVEDSGAIVSAVPVARGNSRSVLAALNNAAPGSVAIHNHPSGLLEPSEADWRIAGDLYHQGVGFAITDNDAGELYVVVEPPPTKKAEPIDEDAIDAVLAPGGEMESGTPATRTVPRSATWLDRLPTPTTPAGSCSPKRGQEQGSRSPT